MSWILLSLEDIFLKTNLKMLKKGLVWSNN